MERREFLSVAAASTCALASSPLAGAACGPDGSAQTQKKYGVKITVLKRGFENEYVEALKTGRRGNRADLPHGATAERQPILPNAAVGRNQSGGWVLPPAMGGNS